MLDLEECRWTAIEVERGAVLLAYWQRYPVVRYQKVMWFASGDTYQTEGYVN